jgi:hypothetical protein
MDARLALAIRDNARWCDLVCRSQGIAGRFDPDAWVSPSRMPPLYPDAVTLRPDVAAPSLLGRIDASPGCSVKDSFADLDLTAADFAVLFEASWIVRAPAVEAATTPDRSALAWERVETAGDLRAWAEDHGGGPIFRPALLDDRSVLILVGRERDGRRAAGAVASVADEAVGISNVFAPEPAVEAERAAAFIGASAEIARRFPDRPVVGYERGASLETARSIGYEAVGPLRVWARPSA